MANYNEWRSRTNRPHARLRTSSQVFDAIERADLAIKKLFLDEELTQAEMEALVASDYLKPILDDRHISSGSLYVPAKFTQAVSSPFLFTSVEREILAYFGRHPELLHSLSPRKFEEIIASVFRQDGYDVEMTPESHDGGIDIMAVKKDGLIGSGLHIIECKRYRVDNTVGIGVVQRLLGVVEQHKATKGIVVTTSHFTRDARIVEESSKHRLALMEYAKVAAWLAAFE